MSFNQYKPLPEHVTSPHLSWVNDALDIIRQCKFPEYTFNVKVDGRGEVYLQAAYFEADTRTHKESIQYTRRWFLSPAMNEGEIVQTAFKCIITSMEHRVREWFTWKDRAVFQPHHNIQKLWEICEERVVRT